MSQKTLKIDKWVKSLSDFTVYSIYFCGSNWHSTKSNNLFIQAMMEVRYCKTLFILFQIPQKQFGIHWSSQANICSVKKLIFLESNTYSVCGRIWGLRSVPYTYINIYDNYYLCIFIVLIIYHIPSLCQCHVRISSITSRLKTCCHRQERLVIF